MVRQYGGVEQTVNHGEIPIVATYNIDEAGMIRYEQIADNLGLLIVVFSSKGFDKAISNKSRIEPVDASMNAFAVSYHVSDR